MIHQDPNRDIILMHPNRRPDLYSDREKRAAAVMLRGLAARNSSYPHRAAQVEQANALARDIENGLPTLEFSPHTRADYAGAALYLRDRASRTPSYDARAALLMAATGADNRAHPDPDAQNC